VHVDRDAAAVVVNGHRAVGVHDDLDVRAIAGESFVDAVVDDLVDQVVQAADARVADVHGGALADRVNAAEDRYGLGVVLGARLLLALLVLFLGHADARSRPGHRRWIRCRLRQVSKLSIRIRTALKRTRYYPR